MSDEEKPWNGVSERRVKSENRLTRIEVNQENLGKRMDGLHAGFGEMREDLKEWQIQLSGTVAEHGTDIKWLNWKVAGEGVGLFLSILGIIYAIMRVQ